MSQITPYHKALLFFFPLFCTYAAKSQRADSVTYYRDSAYYWGGAHLGGGSYLVNLGLDAGILFDNKFIMALKVDWNLNIPEDERAIENYYGSEESFLFGLKLSHHRFSNWSALSGLSFIQIDGRGDVIGSNQYGEYYGPDIHYNGIGLPLVLKYTLSPERHFAMDFSAAANINAQHSYFAITFGLAFGNVRSGVEHG